MPTRNPNLKSLRSDLPQSLASTLGDLSREAFLHIKGVWGYQSQANLNRLIENKIKIVKLFKELPESLRKSLSVSLEDKTLYRGVSSDTLKEFGEWQNGKFTYGFTDSLNTARRFANGHMEHGSRVLTSDDIESYGGVIDLKKLADFIDNYNKSKPFDEQLKELSGWAGIHNESEYLVYDIKFKTRPNGKFYADKPYEQGAWDNYDKFNPLKA
jgi:hypothetical protein